VSRYQNGKTNLDFTEAKDSEWQWHQLGRMQVCTSLQTDNHASTPSLSFLQAGRPKNSIKALKALLLERGTPKESKTESRRQPKREFWACMQAQTDAQPENTPSPAPSIGCDLATYTAV